MNMLSPIEGGNMTAFKPVWGTGEYCESICPRRNEGRDKARQNKICAPCLWRMQQVYKETTNRETQRKALLVPILTEQAIARRRAAS